MIHIPDAPTIQACTTCWRPIVWLWSPRTEAWVAFAPQPADNRVLRVDDCKRADVDRMPSWRDAAVTGHDPNAAERTARGRALVDEALNAARQNSPEGKDHADA